MSQLFVSGGVSYWSFRFNISPSNEQAGLISFKMDCLDFLAVQDTQESSPAPQFEGISSQVLNHLYGPTLTFIHDYLKNHSFHYTDFCCKVMSLLFNALSRFLIAFLPRSKCLSISWRQSQSTVILEPEGGEKKSFTASTFSICHEMMELDPVILVFLMLSFKPVFSLSLNNTCNDNE